METRVAETKSHQTQVVLSPSIEEFYKNYSSIIDGNEPKLLSFFNPLQGYDSQSNPRGDSAIVSSFIKFLESIGLRAKRTSASFKDISSYKNNAIAKIKEFIDKAYPNHSNLHAYPRPFILSTIGEMLIRVHDYYTKNSTAVAEQIEQLSIILKICHFVVKRSDLWKDTPFLTTLLEKSAEKVEFSNVMSAVSAEISKQMDEATKKVKSQRLRASIEGIVGAITEKIIPDLRSILLSSLLPDVTPNNLFLEGEYKEIFNNEHLNFEQFKKIKTLPASDRLFKLVNSQQMFTVVHRHLFSPRLQRLRVDLDNATIKARETLNQERESLETKDRRSSFLIDNSEGNNLQPGSENEYKGEGSNLQLGGKNQQEIVKIAPGVLDSEGNLKEHLIVKPTKLMLAIAKEYHEAKNCNRRAVDIFNALPPFVKSALNLSLRRPALFSISSLHSYNPSSQDDCKLLKEISATSSAGVYVFWGKEFLYATPEMIASPLKLLKAGDRKLLSLKEELNFVECAPGQTLKKHCLSSSLKYSELYAIWKLTAHRFDGTNQDLRFKYLLEGYIYLVNDIFDDYYRVLECSADVEIVSRNIENCGNLFKILGYYQLLTLCNDLTVMSERLQIHLKELLQYTVLLRNFQDFTKSHFIDCADNIEIRAREIFSALGNHGLQKHIINLNESLSQRAISEDVRNALEFLERLAIRQTLIGKHLVGVSPFYQTLQEVSSRLQVNAQLEEKIDRASAIAKRGLMTIGPLGQFTSKTFLTDEITYDEILEMPLPAHPSVTFGELLTGEFKGKEDGSALVKVRDVQIPLGKSVLPIFIEFLQAIRLRNPELMTSSSSHHIFFLMKWSRANQLLLLNQRLVLQEQIKDRFKRDDDDFYFTIFQPKWWWLTGIGLVIAGLGMLVAGVYRLVNRRAIEKDQEIYKMLDDSAIIERAINTIVEENKQSPQQNQSTASIEQIEAKLPKQLQTALTKHLQSELKKQLAGEKTVVKNFNQVIAKVKFKFDHQNDLYHRVRNNKLWYFSWITGVGLVVHTILLLATAVYHRLNQAVLLKDQLMLNNLQERSKAITEYINKINSEIAAFEENMASQEPKPLKPLDRAVMIDSLTSSHLTLIGSGFATAKLNDDADHDKENKNEQMLVVSPR